MACGARPSSPQQLAGRTCRRAHLGELLCRGIEVEHDPVGLAHVVGAAEPDMGRDHVLARQVNERRRVPDEDVTQAAAALLDANVRDPVGEVLRPVLHVVPVGADPERERLHRDGPIAHVPNHDPPDPLVVVREVALRDPGEELLVRVRDLDVVLHASASFGSAT
jgi:hypothetical protein